MGNQPQAGTATEAWRALVTTSLRLVQRLDDELRRAHDVSLPEYEVLMTLGAAPDRRLRHHDLLAPTRLTKSGLSRLADRLEADGLICTARCPSDGRGAFAVLTDLGAARLDAAAATHRALVEEHFARHLSDAEAQILIDLLRRIANDVRSGGETCPAASPPSATAQQAASV